MTFVMCRSCEDLLWVERGDYSESYCPKCVEAQQASCDECGDPVAPGCSCETPLEAALSKLWSEGRELERRARTILDTIDALSARLRVEGQKWKP